jgi:hypothetical protein
MMRKLQHKLWLRICRNKLRPLRHRQHRRLKLLSKLYRRRNTHRGGAAIPTLTALPINAQPVPEDHNKLLVDALPLLQLAGQAKEEEIQLEACQQVNDLKDKQIVELKKKPRFITRIKNVAEAVGVGIAIGFLVK